MVLNDQFHHLGTGSAAPARQSQSSVKTDTHVFIFYNFQSFFPFWKNHAQNQNGTNVTYFTVVLMFPSLMWFVLGPACLTSVQVLRVLGGLREHHCQMQAGSLLRPTSVCNSTHRLAGKSRPEPLFSNTWCLPQRINLTSYFLDKNKVNVQHFAGIFHSPTNIH